MLRGQAMKKKGKEVKEEIEKQQGQGEGKMNGPDIDRHERSPCHHHSYHYPLLAFSI